MSGGGGEWSNPLEFILTTMGFAIGLGNLWRFPYLVFKHGGAIFLLVYLVLIIILGVPIFFLETSIGQFSRLNPIDLFARVIPISEGLGYASILMIGIIGFFYNLVICYCVYFFIVSIRAKLLWTDCGVEPECFVANLTDSTNCTLQLQPYIQAGISPDDVKSPSELYFYNQVLQISDGIANLNGMDYPLPLCFLIAWVIVFVGLLKSIRSLGKISYFTALFPYIVITVLIIIGSLLKGAAKGIEFYIVNFDFKKLSDFNLYQDAAVQAFFSLSACCGGLTMMSTFNKFNNNILRDSIIVPFMDFFTGFYSGFAIFAMLGHMYLSKCVDSFEKVAKPGPELVFVIYPDGISLIGTLAPLVSVLFFLMMLALGFGSELTSMEVLFDSLTVIVKRYTPVNTTFKRVTIRLLIVLVYFLFGLTLVTRGGFYILDLLDAALFDFALLFIGLFELITVPWIYGTKKLKEDIESMIGVKPRIFWIIMTIFWKVISPVIILAIIVLNGIAFKTRPDWPPYVQFFYWLITTSPITMVLGFGIKQIIFNRLKNGYINWRDLITTDPSYYKNKEEHLNGKNGENGSINEKPKDEYEMTAPSDNKKNHHPSRNAVSPIETVNENI